MRVLVPAWKCVIHDVVFLVADYDTHCREFHDGNKITVQPVLVARPEQS